MSAILRDVRLDPSRIPDQEAFPFMLPVVQALHDPLPFHPQVTFLVGENGSGKSTILEALAAKLDLDAQGGDTVLTFVEHPADTPLHEALILARGTRSPTMKYFLRAESFFNVAGHVDGHPGAVAAHGGRPLHRMSHGESFLALALERFSAAVLILEVIGAALALALLGAFLAIVGRGVVAVLSASVLVAFLLFVTCDLDRPTRGWIRVPDTVLESQRASMELPPAAGPPGKRSAAQFGD